MTDDERGGRPRLGAELGARDAREAHDFEAVAAQLGMIAAPVEPRPEVKAAIFARLDGLPQLPPVVAGASPEPVSPSRPAAERARLRWFQRPGAVLSAAAAAVLLFIGGSFFGSVLAGAAPDQQQASALVEINAAPDVRFQSSEVVGGGTATLVWSVQLRQSALVTKGLPKLADDKVYELRPSRPAP
jgi:hypothetical protein